WGLVAVAQAADRNQGEASISSSLSRLDADLLLDAVEHIFVTADVAGHAVAHANDVATHRNAEDLAVESCHAFNIAGGNAENFADGVAGTVRHPAAGVLDDFQRLDGRRARVLVMVHFMLDGRALGFAQGKTVGLNQSAHISGPRRP